MLNIKVMVKTACIGVALALSMLAVAGPARAKASEGDRKQVPPDVVQLMDRMGEAMVKAVLQASPKDRSVAVMDFQNLGPDAVDMKIGETMGEMLNAALVKSGKVMVIDRKNIQRVMEEIALGQTGLVDEATAAEAGNIVGASVIITGTASHVGNIFMVTSRAVEVKSAKVVGVHAARVPDELLISVAAQYYDLHRYPMNAVFRSMLMPGWGQFFNNQPRKGYMILGSEAALLAGALWLHLAAASEFDEYHNNDPDSVDAADTGDSLLLYRNITFGIAGGVWAYAVTDAYLQIRKYNKRIYGAGTEKKEKKKTSLKIMPLFDNDDALGIGLVYSY